MNSPEDALQSRSQCDDMPAICRNCWHPEHADYICGEFGEEVMITCLCDVYEPADAEDILSREGKI